MNYFREPRREHTMKSLLAALAILVPCNTVLTYHAAGHLVAAQVVRERPLPLLDEMGEAL